jgi:hypothetical protein
MYKPPSCAILLTVDFKCRLLYTHLQSSSKFTFINASFPIIRHRLLFKFSAKRASWEDVSFRVSLEEICCKQVYHALSSNCNHFQFRFFHNYDYFALFKQFLLQCAYTSKRYVLRLHQYDQKSLCQEIIISASFTKFKIYLQLYATGL